MQICLFVCLLETIQGRYPHQKCENFNTKKNKGTGKKVKKTKVAPTATVVSEAPAPVKDQTVSISLPAQKHDEPAKVDAAIPGPAPSLISSVQAIPKPETSFLCQLTLCHHSAAWAYASASASA